jgi:hypothetical protein
MHHQPDNQETDTRTPRVRRDPERIPRFLPSCPFGLPPETRPANPPIRASTQDTGATVATNEDRPITKELGMYAATARVMTRRALCALTAGDIRPLLSSYSDDAVLTLPGPSPWAAN